MAEARGPVILFDRNGTALVAEDYRSAVEEVEAVDVLDGEYHGYDADGYVLILRCAGKVLDISRSSERAYEEAVDQVARARPDNVVPGEPLHQMLRRMISADKNASLGGRILRRLRRADY